jgi:oligoribonuclease (3'-5' exoribonuclease)
MESRNLNGLTDCEKIAINAEISGLDTALSGNLELKKRMEESSQAVTDEALKIIESMDLAFTSKSESIESMRSWRKTIVSESTQATNAINALLKNVSSEKLAQLKEIVLLLERLNKIEPNLMVGKLFSTPTGE